MDTERVALTYGEWCKEKGVAHAHCPYDCEHPQPFIAMDGSLLCGRCWYKHQLITHMIPCTPDVCE